MVMARRGPGIGADFRVERRVEPGDMPAQPLDHRGDDMIRANPQPPLQRLQGQMPVAEVPGDAQQVGRAVGGDLDDRLGGGAHPDIAAIVEFEPVTLGKTLGARQIEQKRRPGLGNEADAAPMAIEKRQCYAVDRRFVGPMASRMNGDRPPHSFYLGSFTTDTRRTRRFYLSLRAKRSNLDGIASSLRSSQ